MPEILEYAEEGGNPPFGLWFWNLESCAGVHVRCTILKLERGLQPNVRGLGEGVFESKIHFGAGYRLYFGVDGADLVILLGGGDKTSQLTDVIRAQDKVGDV